MVPSHPPAPQVRLQAVGADRATSPLRQLLHLADYQRACSRDLQPSGSVKVNFLSQHHWVAVREERDGDVVKLWVQWAPAFLGNETAGPVCNGPRQCEVILSECHHHDATLRL
eukprot:CAMPEP_0171227886 /NCGR_PEP_ID=MMETSP0790-20130122/38078_1 /TAXON_ID=2925 /ORGANISM="Alexandrium catenella, Strain OF101" /LENGTH=112 /DNA_ID=CAMNT_0011694013 /DNA_START=589 /DNA_END=924 /DNA_ORIENTATION=-